MSYKPQTAQTATKSVNTGIAPNGKPYLYPKPEAGNQAARISLIVDIGTQEREDFEDKATGEVKPQKPVQQVVVFADLVDQVVDYGGDIGEKQYRLMLNKSFSGVIQGINFTAVPPRDADGNMIKDKVWTFHPANALTKLAKATGNDQILGVDTENNMDISQLLGAAFYADVDVKETDSGKKKEDGTPIIYTNVNFKGASKLPQVKGKPVEVDALQVEPMILNHFNITEETLPLIRGKVLEMMKKAAEYQGSPLQKLVGGNEQGVGKIQAEPEQKEESPVKAKPVEREVKNAPPIDFDDDIPFLGYMKGKLSYVV